MCDSVTLIVWQWRCDIDIVTLTVWQWQCDNHIEEALIWRRGGDARLYDIIWWLWIWRDTEFDVTLNLTWHLLPANSSPTIDHLYFCYSNQICAHSSVARSHRPLCALSLSLVTSPALRSQSISHPSPALCSKSISRHIARSALSVYLSSVACSVLSVYLSLTNIKGVAVTPSPQSSSLCSRYDNMTYDCSLRSTATGTSVSLRLGITR